MIGRAKKPQMESNAIGMPIQMKRNAGNILQQPSSQQTTMSFSQIPQQQMHPQWSQRDVNGIDMSQTPLPAPSYSPLNREEQQQQQKKEADNHVCEVESLMLPIKDSLLTLMQEAERSLRLSENSSENLMVKLKINYANHLENFAEYCDQVEMQLKTEIQYKNQSESAQHYLPETVGVQANNSNVMTSPSYGGPK